MKLTLSMCTAAGGIFLGAWLSHIFFGGWLLPVLWVLGWFCLHYYQQFLLMGWANTGQFTSEGFGTWGQVFRQIARKSRKQKKRLAQLQTRIHSLEKVLFQLPNGVLLMDERYVLEWCNEVASKHLGLQQHDEGIRLTHLVRNPSFVAYLQQGNFSHGLNLSFYQYDLYVQVLPLNMSGSKKILMVTQDQSAQKQVERLRRDFVANASHELRSPLTVINGFLELAMEERLHNTPTSWQTHLPLMFAESQRMMRLVDDMQTLSQLEKDEGGEQPDSLPCAVLPVLRSLQDTIAYWASKQKNIRVVLQESEEALAFVCIKIPQQDLHSAVNNLLTNAVQYTPNGGLVQLGLRKSTSGEVLIYVQDHGVGIAAHHIPRLTERFYRADEHLSRQVQGTGLGLAIVKHIMLRVGGKLDIESQLGQGSCFTLTFPVSVVYYEDNNRDV